MKISFIGTGKMGSAIISGIISGILPENITAYDKNHERTDELSEKFGINKTDNAEHAVKIADIIFLCVKPFVIKEVLNEIKPFLTEDKIIVSIAAGISIADIEEILDKPHLVRVMPNIPVEIKKGICAVCKGSFTSDNDLKKITDILKHCGHVEEAREEEFEIITAISGSSPAFFAKFINDFALAACKFGISYEKALKFAQYSAAGTSEYLISTGMPCETLIKNVTTPGGCTEEGNKVLEKYNVKDIIFETTKQTVNKLKKFN